jgi:hypothetical protein
VLACAAGLAAFLWSLVPWKVRAELAIASEPAPPPVAIAAMWNGGWRSIAIGDGGAVFEHVEWPGEPGAWRAVASPVHDDLFAVDGGDWPSPHRGDTRLDDHRPRVLVAGAHGTLLDCSGAGCVSVPTGTGAALRAVAVGFGQAFAAGDGGTLLHVKPVIDGGDALVAELVALDTTATLRSVSLECHGLLGECSAIAVGDGGVMVEGTGTGPCPMFRTSGTSNGTCAWSWRRAGPPEGVARREAGARDPGAAASLPVRVVESKLGRRRSHVEWAAVEPAPAPRALVGGRWIPLGGAPWKAVATREGHPPLLLDAAGRLHALSE